VVPVARDRYGRLIATVFLPDGRSLAPSLLQAGLAWTDGASATTDEAMKALELIALGGFLGVLEPCSSLHLRPALLGANPELSTEKE
jgi:hypothetical protein